MIRGHGFKWLPRGSGEDGPGQAVILYVAMIRVSGLSTLTLRGGDEQTFQVSGRQAVRSVQSTRVVLVPVAGLKPRGRSGSRLMI